jgi:hypothetical protein
MYGLVNQAIRDLIISQHGEEKWLAVSKKAGIGPAEFEAMKSYPDGLTYALVGSASEVLGADSSSLLKAFGEYWIRFTAEEGYGEMMDLFGRDFMTCLNNLNGMHAHMGVMMPELQPPRFQVEEQGSGRFKLHYFSKRAGLAPMVEGLLEGLAKKHGTRIGVVHLPRAASDDHETFEIEVLG